MNEITVLNVVPDERFGGPQQRVLLVAKRLKEKGTKTIVVMPEGDNTYARMLDDAHIPFFRSRSFRRLPNPSNLPGIILWFCYFLPCMFFMIRLIRKHGIDIVHVNGALNVQASLAARLSGAKLVWHLNDVRRSVLTRPLRLILTAMSHEMAGASMAVERCYFGKNSSGRMTILYPPVDTGDFHPDHTRVEEYRREFRITPNDKVIGIVGNLNPFKGYEYFLQAAKLIKQASPAVKFLIVGKRLDTHENYWHRVQSLIADLQIEDDVIFTGHRSDICEILNMVDIFVLSSILEAAPIVVLEAMACGKPIVATSVGGVPELIVDGQTGILVPAKDAKAIASAIQYLVSHPEEAKQMGINARKRAVAHFDISICAKRHEEVYSGILGAR